MDKENATVEVTAVPLWNKAGDVGGVVSLTIRGEGGDLVTAIEINFRLNTSRLAVGVPRLANTGVGAKLLEPRQEIEVPIQSAKDGSSHLGLIKIERF